MKALNSVVLALVLIGAINWGLVGFFQFDLVAAIFGGPDTTASRIVYALVGIAGLYGLSFFGRLAAEPETRSDHTAH